jgi:hypothetical protein
VHEMKQDFFLRDLEGKGILFCLLSVVESAHGRPVRAAWFNRTSMVMGTPYGGASAPRSNPTASLCPPFDPRPIQWLQSEKISSNLVAARVRRLSSLASKNSCHGVCYL